MDRKQFLVLLAALSANANYLSITAPNYNCLDSVIGLDTQDTNGSVIISSDGSFIINNSQNLLAFNNGTTAFVKGN